MHPDPPPMSLRPFIIKWWIELTWVLDVCWFLIFMIKDLKDSKISYIMSKQLYLEKNWFTGSDVTWMFLCCMVCFSNSNQGNVLEANHTFMMLIQM